MKKKIKWIEENKVLLKLFFNINQIIYTTSNSKVFDFLSSGFKFGIVCDEKKNVNDEITKKIRFYKEEVKFFENKLKNKNFLSKAPLKIVSENKEKLKEAKKNLNLLINKNV